MATSGTFNFLPSVGELVLNAYGRIQLRGPALTAQHFVDARLESNFLQIEWSNEGVNLWTVDLQQVTVTQGTTSIAVPSTTIDILDVYITQSPGSSAARDRPILRISRSDFAALPNKLAQGPPTQYWFDRLISPTLTPWPVPNTTYTLNYYRWRQIQDAVIAGGIQPEIPYRWFDAWAAGLSHRLARLHAPALEAQRKIDAKEAWQNAAKQDIEGTNMRIQPMISAYRVR